MRSVVLIISIVFAFGVSCTEEIKPTPFDYSKIFSGNTSKTWVVRGWVLYRERNGTIDINSNQFTGLHACIRDDRYILYANSERTFEITNGPIKCASEEPDLLFSDSWTFINAGSTLNITIPFIVDFPLPYIVKEVSRSDMTLMIYFDEEGTVWYEIKFESISEN